MKTKAETGAMRLQVQEHQGWPANSQKPGKRPGREPALRASPIRDAWPQNPAENKPLLTPPPAWGALLVPPQETNTLDLPQTWLIGMSYSFLPETAAS